MDGSLSALYENGQYLDVIDSPQGRALVAEATARIHAHSDKSCSSSHVNGKEDLLHPVPDRVLVGIAALDAFLQVNVTGPVLAGAGRIEKVFGDTFRALEGDGGRDDSSLAVLANLRKACLGWLEVDGVGPYPHVPYIELFCLARHLLLLSSSNNSSSSSSEPVIILSPALRVSPAWLRLRINTWHYKLLTQPSLTRGAHWSDVPSLVEALVEGVDAARSLVGQDQEQDQDQDQEQEQDQEQDQDQDQDQDQWPDEDKVLCLVELANVSIMLGREDAARKLLRDAVALSGLQHALTGALGKRTRFQQKDISQLVVLAKSRCEEHHKGVVAPDEARPDALPLNDDTLLEHIEYSGRKPNNETKQQLQETALVPEALVPEALVPEALVPAALAALDPEKQPQLRPADQMILLAEATLRDSFSPADTLTLAEVLPYAVRVLDDKSTNWQIYTQALIVRSRIEMHRSRTVERGVLQLQAVVDQVIVDMTTTAPPKEGIEEAVITITPTSFFPAPKPQESASAPTRLRYMHAISSSPRWHLESELGFAWVHVGSFVSALDIFKRLRLWAEIALCLSATDNDSGRRGGGASGETKARGLLRWRLFTRTGTPDPPPPSYPPDPDDDVPPATDPTTIAPSSFTGPFRSPAPPSAPRLLCILGELESEPSHYELAWHVSRGRYARAQKALGEHHIRRKDWASAKEAFRLAVSANRLSPELWSRLGDMALRLGHFAEAAGAFGRAVAAAGEVSLGAEDARTWSNLGSALLSLYSERLEQGKEDNDDDNDHHHDHADDDQPDLQSVDYAVPLRHKSPDALLAQSLAAYKRGAAIAHSNWRIWDNVLTLAGRTRPPSYGDMINATWQILHLRKSEDAVDVDVLRSMLQNAVLSTDPPGAPETLPPRGSHARAIVDLLENNVAPLITRRADLWELIWRERGWRRDYKGAVDAAEKAWRTEMSGGGANTDADAQMWRVDVDAWKTLVRRTQDLVSVLENWGSRIDDMAHDKWRAKARNAVRSVMSKGKAAWGGGEGWRELEDALDCLSPARKSQAQN